MKKELQKRINTFVVKSLQDFLDTGGVKYGGAVYFTRCVPNALYKKEKYFFMYENTHSVRSAFRTQKEISDFLSQHGI